MPPSRKKAKFEDVENPSALVPALPSAPLAPLPSRRLRGRRGGLKDMMNMPIDVLIEIFSHMHPRDLLSLARTTRDLRAFLTSRRASLLSWHTARRRQAQSLPECPPFLSEVAYANLVFCSACDGCGKKGTKVAQWELGVRFCSHCRDMLVVPAAFGSDRSTTQLYSVVHTLTPQAEDFLVTLQIIGKGKHCGLGKYHLRADVEAFNTKLNKLPTEIEKISYIIDAIENVGARMKFSDAMKEWQSSEEENRLSELAQLREARYEEITNRLRGEGWGEELDLMSFRDSRELSTHKCVAKSQKLTDRSWLTIRPSLTSLMRNMQEVRIREAHRKCVRERLGFMYTALIQYDDARRKRTAEQDWQPSIVDLGLMDEFRTLVEASNNASITTGSFLDLLPDTMQSWKLARQSEFVKMMVAAVPSIASHPTPLKLAIALFDCTKCSRRELRWPQILAHRCPRVQQIIYCDPYRLMLEEVRRLHSQPHPWITEGSFTFARPEELENIQSAISACGVHWSAATHDEMEAMRLACRICRKSSRDSCIVLDWRRLELHSNSILGDTYHEPVWESLYGEHYSRVRRNEAQQKESLKETTEKYGCRRCHHVGPLNSFRIHYATNHCGIAFGGLSNVDFYVHTDNPKTFTPSPVWITHPRSFKGLSTPRTNAEIVSSTFFDNPLDNGAPPGPSNVAAAGCSWGGSESSNRVEAPEETHSLKNDSLPPEVISKDNTLSGAMGGLW